MYRKEQKKNSRIETNRLGKEKKNPKRKGKKNRKSKKKRKKNESPNRNGIEKSKLQHFCKNVKNLRGTFSALKSKF